MKTLTSYYEVLGVGPTAEAETLRKAYRRLARKHHPDVSVDPRAHENMARINQAFEILIDPAKRNEYDALLAGTGHHEDKPKEAKKPVVVRLVQRLQSHKTPVYALSFAPDTGQLISSGFDNEILWWHPEQSVAQRRMRLEAGVISTLRAFSMDRLVVAGSAESQISYCRLDGDKVEQFRTSPEEWVGCLAISSDGSALAAGSLHRTLSVTDTENGTSLFKQKGHDDAVTAVAWSLDGRLLATGSADATVKIWDPVTGEMIRDLRQVRSTVTALAFSNNGKFLVTAAVDLSLRVFDLSTGELVKMMYGHTKTVEALAFHPNNWLFASASRDGSVGLWNAAKGIGNVRIEASSRPINCVGFSPDGTRLAAAGQDKTVRVWEVAAKDME
ncbi:MAG TPA: DnaJ domain-containing protein [Fimbriimonas sp.]|nr:DnaJ domain-containing protein [Fimbriimonas sp.]